jgi:pimeloyl-ACP methyl ester carboxylesterase
MHQLGLDEHDILLANLDGDELGLPRHFVARDLVSKSIVVCIRGTNSVSDVLVDLLCDSAPFATGYAHVGMRDAAYAVYACCADTVRAALAANKGFKLVVTGHSMGGGIAVLLTKILLDNSFTQLSCFAISPPPVFGPVHAVDNAWSEALECYILEEDIVPRLSLASARSLVMEIERVDALPLSDSDLRGLDNANLHDTIAGNAHVLFDEREQIAAPLYHPSSHINWLLPSEKCSREALDEVTARRKDRGRSPTHCCVRAEPAVLSRMLITRQCVTSHFPNRYYDAFDALLGIPPRKRRPRKEYPAKQTPALYYYGELGL